MVTYFVSKTHFVRLRVSLREPLHLSDTQLHRVSHSAHALVLFGLSLAMDQSNGQQPYPGEDRKQRQLLGVHYPDLTPAGRWRYRRSRSIYAVRLGELQIKNGVEILAPTPFKRRTNVGTGYTNASTQRNPGLQIPEDTRHICRRLTSACRQIVRIVYADKAWPRISSCINKVFNRQVRRLAAAGALAKSRASRMLRCQASRSPDNAVARWRCETLWCPRCWRWRTLNLLRSINANVVQAELNRRKEAGGGRRRRRLVLGTVEETVADPAQLSAVLRSMSRQERIRKIMRAGSVEEGVAFTAVLPQSAPRGWRLRIRLSVLGLSERAVHIDQPQPRSGEWHIKWHTKVTGHNLPKLGAGPLEDLLMIAFPYAAAMLDPSLPLGLAKVIVETRQKAVQPLGSWRDFVSFRPSERLPTCEYRNAARQPHEPEFDKVNSVKQARFERRVCKKLLRVLGASEVGIALLQRQGDEGAPVICGFSPEWLSYELNCPVTIRAVRDFVLEQRDAFPPPSWFEHNTLDDRPTLRNLWTKLWTETIDRFGGNTGRCPVAVVFRPYWARPKERKRRAKICMSRIERLGRGSTLVVLHNIDTLFADAMLRTYPAVLVQRRNPSTREREPVAAMQYLDDFGMLLRDVWGPPDWVRDAIGYT